MSDSRELLSKFLQVQETLATALLFHIEHEELRYKEEKEENIKREVRYEEEEKEKEEKYEVRYEEEEEEEEEEEVKLPTTFMITKKSLVTCESVNIRRELKAFSKRFTKMNKEARKRGITLLNPYLYMLHKEAMKKYVNKSEFSKKWKCIKENPIAYREILRDTLAYNEKKLYFD